MKVLVISARGLRADYLGCYGNPRVETRALDALAAGGIVFDRHFADAADSAGARNAWRTGRYFGSVGEPPGGGADLIQLLGGHGVRTSLVIDESRPKPVTFAADWQQVIAGSEGEGDSPLEQTIDRTRKALRNLRKTERWLLWVDIATTLPPWDVPFDFADHYFRDEIVEDEEAEGDDEEAVEVEPLLPLPAPPLGRIESDDDTLYLRIQGSYSGAVTYLDAGIGELLKSVPSDVLVVVTSDVGIALGEHGVVGPGLDWPAESVCQIPLIVRLPSRTTPGYRVPAITQAVDLGPTIASWFGLAIPNAHGHDLMPLVNDEAEAVRPYAISRVVVDSRVGHALRSPEWSFVVPATTGDATPRLYVRPDDRWEVTDVRQHHLEWTEALEQILRAFEGAIHQPGPLHVPPLPEFTTTESPAE